MSAPGNSFWRVAGLTYNQYCQVGAQAVRNCLKPEFTAAAAPRGEVSMKLRTWVGGKGGEKSKF